MDEYPISRIYRDARVMRIYAGTNEIMKLLIARQPVSALRRQRWRLHDDRRLHLRHVRTPRGRGKADGSLHEVTALNLAAQALGAIKDRNKLDPTLVDDVVLGCVDPVGEAGGDIARVAAIMAGYGDSVPGVQINRFCASGLDAVNFAAAEVMSGQHDMTIGGGVESMSRVGIGASGGAWPVDPSIALKSYFLPQGISADLIATKYGFSRDDVDAYAVESQKRAAQVLGGGPLQEFGDAGQGRQRPDAARQGRAHAADDRRCSRWRSSSRPSCRWARWRASTRSRCSAIRRSRRSITSITPAIRPASSTAPPPC